MKITEIRKVYKRAKGHLADVVNRLSNHVLNVPLYEHPDFLEARDAMWKAHDELMAAYGENR